VPDGDTFRKFIVDAVTEQITEKANRQAEHIASKAGRQAERQLAKAARHVARHLDTLDTWTRTEPGARRPRLSRQDIAEAAVKIADAEGFDAVSMRRIATDLDVGTMTLYHYVRTKDELLTLVMDSIMGEVVVPPDQPLPDDWREAISVIARRSRDSFRAHPWILDIRDDPGLGPNSVLHFDQCVQALESLNADLGTKFDVITAVDEYVFGYCLHERNDFRDDDAGRHIVSYILDLVASGGYPAIAQLIEAEGTAGLWAKLTAHANDPTRFDRNLARLLAGFMASAP
jgi:AcrR family transcriptional regulator